MADTAPSVPERTFQFQDQLPPLPVPCLHQSLQKYLDAVKPFASEEEFRATVDTVQRFEDGVGKELHLKLKQRASQKRNWLEEWWLDAAYLEVRAPSQLYVNFGGPAPYLEHCWPPAEGVDLHRASISTWHSLQYWNMIRTYECYVHFPFKCGRIGKPFVKVEDSSRHYRPFYRRLTNVPEFNLATIPPCTPFCLEDRDAAGNRAQCQRGARASDSDERPNERKKKKQGGYCECCLVKYDNITTHLQSDRHQTFAKSDEYLVVDKLVSAMHCSFTHIRSKHKRPKCSVSTVLIAPGPFVEPKPKVEDRVNLAVKLDLAQSHSSNEKREGSGSASKSLCAASPVVHRLNRRKKTYSLSDSKHVPKLLSKQDPTSATDELQPHRVVAPSTGDSAAAHPAFSEVQLSDRHGSETPAAVNVQREPSPETLKTNLTKLRESPHCAPAHREILVYKQSTENSVSLKEVLSEDFVPVERIKRKIKVYKRKRRKKTALMSGDRVEQSGGVGDGLMRLWELFQDSDDMDMEFHGFE
ncbi:uncharacterized protein [Eucyclogobius newberryi]|uniref:uncharacterized protein n=1 Tax=Eucyclogobius newberryi TaxID=166745 RepID=UPI003B5BEA37